MYIWLDTFFCLYYVKHDFCCSSAIYLLKNSFFCEQDFICLPVVLFHNTFNLKKIIELYFSRMVTLTLKMLKPTYPYNFKKHVNVKWFYLCFYSIAIKTTLHSPLDVMYLSSMVHTQFENASSNLSI